MGESDDSSQTRPLGIGDLAAVTVAATIPDRLGPMVRRLVALATITEA